MHWDFPCQILFYAQLRIQPVPCHRVLATDHCMDLSKLRFRWFGRSPLINLTRIWPEPPLGGRRRGQARRPPGPAASLGSANIPAHQMNYPEAQARSLGLQSHSTDSIERPEPGPPARAGVAWASWGTASEIRV